MRRYKQNKQIPMFVHVVRPLNSSLPDDTVWILKRFLFDGRVVVIVVVLPPPPSTQVPSSLTAATGVCQTCSRGVNPFFINQLSHLCVFDRWSGGGSVTQTNLTRSTSCGRWRNRWVSDFDGTSSGPDVDMKQKSFCYLKQRFVEVWFLLALRLSSPEKTGTASRQVPSGGNWVQKVAEDSWWAGESNSQTGERERESIKVNWVNGPKWRRAAGRLWTVSWSQHNRLHWCCEAKVGK